MNERNRGTESSKSATPVIALRCRDLTQTGILDAEKCCERCHSADRYAPAGTLGPCRVTLDDGREAFVCCAARIQLSR